MHGFGLFAEEHEAFRRTVRSVIEKEIRPHARAWEAAGEFPRELYSRFGELGFLGLKYEEVHGGTNAGPLYEAVLIEELGRCGSGGVSAGLAAQFTISTGPLHLFGTESRSGASSRRRFAARRSGRWGSPSPTRAATSPASAPARFAREPTTSSTARRRTSPTACAPTSWCSR
jgi:alkylation response protein AidB-like acyl-CoA dehydrogenase